MTTDATTPRQFALEVVQRLRGADFEAYWAGGCVRDGLLGREPKDYDVATSATPDQIRTLFGRRRTLPLGAAFGVITILGPPQAGPVEVATFRQDATYSDGRHPDSVRFSSAQEDAQRRDFTVNGLFYDPVADQVIDYVGGRQDIDRRVIRAVGDPLQRFTEDKLRMLRAVRFSAAYEFSLEPKTFEAIRRMAPEINVVSPERISMEMKRNLVDQNRAWGMRLLGNT
jgi:poly(A) polymerase